VTDTLMFTERGRNDIRVDRAGPSVARTPPSRRAFQTIAELRAFQAELAEFAMYIDGVIDARETGRRAYLSVVSKLLIKLLYRLSPQKVITLVYPLIDKSLCNSIVGELLRPTLIYSAR